ncbi:MAG: hypothetical protein PHI88_01775 [Candidatus Pacebacteria bacterium]|nr:hypothetical protein [Candidatus Paceibacterota bacterium]
MINFNIESIPLFFQSEAWQNIISILQPVSLLAILIFLTVIIWALWKSSWIYWYISADFLDFARGGKTAGENAIQKKWKKIKKRIESPSEANWKLAVIESEEIVENVLSKMGYKGEGIKEKLKNVKEAQIPNVSDLISAHDIFINILADPDYKFTRDKAVKIFSSFEEFLKNAEVL